MTETFSYLPPSTQSVIEANEDIFGRDDFGAKITNLVKSSNEPLVLLLDEPWGMGKTVFAKRLDKAVENDDEELNSIYFDAFKRDYESDPFIGLVSEIYERVVPDDKKEGFIKNAKGVANIMGRVALKASVRLATAGIVNSRDLSEAVEEAADYVGDSVESEFDRIIDERLKSSKDDENVFEGFEKTLKDMAQEKPLLVIVDELDRCKPTYALSFLETIKHFFEVHNVHFLLITNLDALAATVEHQYGKINGQTYLQKFYSFRLNFPLSSDYESRERARRFIGHCLGSLDVNNEDRALLDGLHDFVFKRYLSGEYTLRQCEKLCSQIKLAVLFSSNRYVRLHQIAAVLVDLKLFDHALYASARSGGLKFSELCRRYNWQADVSPRSKEKNHTGVWWRFCLESPEGEEWSSFARSLTFSWDIDDNYQIITHTINEVVDCLPSS